MRSEVKARKIHFIGIGGIGVSALAAWYLSQGWELSGSDLVGSPIINKLRSKGAKIKIGLHQKKWLPKDVELVVFSAAISPDNPERKEAVSRSIPVLKYAAALGEVIKSLKVIAISGAHGKSTTTAMVALILIRAGFDPTVFVGTKLREFSGTNFRKGKSEWVVIEADEFNKSFLNYYPYAAITTNIDREHLDFYKTYKNIKKAFCKFFLNVSKIIVLNHDNKDLSSIDLRIKAKILWYSINSKRSQELEKILKVPGQHNLSNALAADRLAESLGIKKKVRNMALSSFRGTWRRFEYKGLYHGSKVFDDYAHHPTEIRATLEGARAKFPKKRVWCVFQPHLNARLESLFSDFTKAFFGIDRVTILETYRVEGREQKDYKFRNAKALAIKLKGVRVKEYAENEKELFKLISKQITQNDLLICMGAGDVWKVTERLLGEHL